MCLHRQEYPAAGIGVAEEVQRRVDERQGPDVPPPEEEGAEDEPVDEVQAEGDHDGGGQGGQAIGADSTPRMRAGRPARLFRFFAPPVEFPPRTQ